MRGRAKGHALTASFRLCSHHVGLQRAPDLRRPIPVPPERGMPSLVTIVPIAEIDPVLIEQLLDHAFGRDRHDRTAYRIRAGASAIPGLSFAALEAGEVAGSIQCWPASLTADSGSVVPLVMVGPVAVEPVMQQRGIGRLLMRHMLVTARAAQQDNGLVLIGDPEYYGRFFGFSAERTGRWRVPGPVDRHRLLARGKNVPHDAGSLGPRIAVRA